MKKVKTIFFIFILSFWGSQITIAQNVKIYSPEADVSMAISQGLIKAKAENKHLLLQIGGNWCPWCLKFHKFCSDDQEISLFISKNYIKILVNYSKENRQFRRTEKT
jgi:thioredoxin-related protein